MNYNWTITYITTEGVHSFLEADNKVGATEVVRELVDSGVELDRITVFPHCTGQLGSDFYVEVPGLEAGQYCIMFTDGDNIVVDENGVLLDSDDPECPNRLDSIYNTNIGMSAPWSIVKECVDKGVEYDNGYYKAEIDNQINGTIQRIVRGTL